MSLVRARPFARILFMAACVYFNLAYHVLLHLSAVHPSHHVGMQSQQV
jgi:hypothetical protein